MSDRVNLPRTASQWLGAGGSSSPPGTVKRLIHDSEKSRTLGRLILENLPSDWPMAFALKGNTLIICVSSSVHCHWLKLYGPSILRTITERSDVRYTLSVKTDPGLLMTVSSPRRIRPFVALSPTTRTLLRRTADHIDHPGLKNALLGLARSPSI